MLGLGSHAKEGNVATFLSAADLDRELGPNRYRLAAPVDFSRHSLVRVGWVPELSSTGALEHTVRLGGLIVLFDVDSRRFDSPGEHHVAQDAWFIVPRFAVGAAAVPRDVRLKDGAAWLAIAALGFLSFVWLTRRPRGRKPEHRLERATHGLPAAAR
jgi:hypothetical protein